MVDLDNNNNNNTIIENVEYLDMLDPKNSWYFDAERFDLNFPLVRSYNGGRQTSLGDCFRHGMSIGTGCLPTTAVFRVWPVYASLLILPIWVMILPNIIT